MLSSPFDRLQKWFRAFRWPTRQQLVRLPSVLTLRERVLLAAGVAAIIAGGTIVTANAYVRTTTAQPAVGGTYVEGIVGEPRLVNPLFAPANDADVDLTRLLFSGLFRTNELGVIVPDLAERHEVAADGKTITVVLREGIRWHDGAELTADDVVFTVHLIQNPNVVSPLRTAFRGVTVDRVDERTVRFTIDRPFAVFLSALTVGVLPEHLWSEIPPTHLTLAELNLRPIGAGPYRFVGLTKDRRGSIRSYTLERYASFHAQPPFLERITFRFFPSDDQLLAAFQNREVDGIGTLAPLSENAAVRRDVVRYPLRLPSSTAVFLNQRRYEPLRDDAVRLALDRSVDRRAIVSDVFHGAAAAIGGPVIVGFSPTADPPVPEPPDAGAAADALDRAKWERMAPDAYLAARTQQELRALEAEKRKTAGARAVIPPPTDEERKTIEERVRHEMEPGCTGCPVQPYYRMKGGAPLAVTVTTASVPELIATAERVRDAWRAIGIRVAIDAVPLERLRNDIIPQRAYDTLLFSQILGPDPDPFPFWHSSQVRAPGLNLAYFSNKAIDKLLEEARATLDRDVRGQKYAAFQKLLAEERPAIFLTTPTLTYAVSRAVMGLRITEITQPADRFATITEWYTETKRTRKK